MKFPWSIRLLRPWLFHRWERERRETLAADGSAGTPLGAGAFAPRFDLPDERGRVRPSEEWIGRGDAVVWFTNLCDLCADQARELAAARARGDWTSPLVAVHLAGGGAPSPAAFERATGSGIPVVVDDGSVTRAWTGEAVPDTWPLVNVFVVDEGGRIALADHLREPRVLVEWLGRRRAISPGA